MALTERRYIFLSRGGLVQRAPLQTQSVHTILTAACTGCNCLPEIATSAYGLLAMTNLVAGAVGGVHRNLQLPMALTERRYSQTWQRIRSAMPFPFRQCLPEIATAPLGPRNDKLGSLAPQNMCRKDCQPARRALSAATDAIGAHHFNGGLYELQVPSRDCHVGLRPPRNDKPLASTILTTAC